MRTVLASWVIALFVGCGSAGNTGYSLDVGGDDAGSIAFVAGDASGAQGLDAYIERSDVAVAFITLSCAGDCAAVEAVGTGGYPPYTFEWDDGSTSATRQVCPTSSMDYSVRVTDTGTVGEVSQPVQTVSASLTAAVLECPDGGSSACSDAGAPGAGVQSGHYAGTVYCPPDGGVINVPTADGGQSSGTVAINLSVNGTAVGGSLYFIWSVGGAIAWQADLAGALQCPEGDLEATWENPRGGCPRPDPTAA